MLGLGALSETPLSTLSGEGAAEPGATQFIMPLGIASAEAFGRPRCKRLASRLGGGVSHERPNRWMDEPAWVEDEEEVLVASLLVALGEER